MSAWASSELRANIADVARLDVSVWRRLRRDVTMTVPALVALASAVFLAGLGTFIWFGVEIDWSWTVFWKTALIGSLLMGAFWFGTLVLAFGVLRRDEPSTIFSEVWRVGGFAAVPLALGFFVFIPRVGFGIGVLAAGLAAAVLAAVIQIAFDATPRRALAAVAPGFALWCLLLPVFVTSDEPLGAGIFGMSWGNAAVLDIIHALQTAFAGIGG